MAKASPAYTSFNGGEVSPSFEGRIDLPKYQTSCKQILNMIPMVQGPLKRRSGTRFVSEVKTSGKRTWLVRFEFSETQAYILEFGDQYIRFYTNQGRVESPPGTAYEISSPYTEADLNANGSLALRTVQSGDIIYIVHPNHAPRKLSRFGPTNWTLTTVDFVGGPFQDLDPDETRTVYASATTGTVTLTASAAMFQASDVGSLFYMEMQDGGGLKPWESQKPFNKNQNPLNQIRTSEGKIYKCVTNATPASGEYRYTGSTRPIHTEGVFADGFFNRIDGTSQDGIVGVEWEYQSLRYGIVRITGFTSSTQVTATVLLRLPNAVVDTTPGSTKTVSAMAANAFGKIRITATGHGLTAPTGITGTLNYFYQTDPGPPPTNDPRSVSGIFIATPIDANTLDLDRNFPSEYTGFTSGSITITGTSGGTTSRWAFGKWSASRGWPTEVCFYRERLVFATGQDIDFSVAGDFENFADRNDSGEVAPDQAISVQIASDQVNKIEWMSPSDRLVVGTTGAEFVIGEATTDEPLGPANIKVVQESLFGSRGVTPVQIGSIVIFVQRAGRKMRSIEYEFSSDGYISKDLTILAEHITDGGLTDIAYQQEPHSIVWATRADGALLGFTFNIEQQVEGWHRHAIGGNGIVECLEVIPRPDGTQDDLWMIVRRTINGQTKRYIEFLEGDYTERSNPNSMFFADSGLSYNGSAVTTLAGLDHLEGETVSITINGGAHPDRVVTGGAVTLQVPATFASVGLPYQSFLQTLRIEAGAQDGTAQGKTKRITKAVIRFLATLGAKAGADVNALDEIQFRFGSDPMDQPPSVFTGDKLIEWPNGYDFDGYIYVSQEQALPMTVVAIFPQVVTQDR